MLKPTYKIAIGNTTMSSKALRPFTALDVQLSKALIADEAVILLGRSAEAAVSQDDDVTVELGWDGSTQLVFTGSVPAIESGLANVEVTCAGTQRKLMRARTDKAFVSQAAGEVVTALAAQAGVDTDTVDDGIDLPVYLVDSRTSLYDHCAGLAVRSGFDFYNTAEGKLVFSAFTSGSTDHTFQYGVQILATNVQRSAPIDEVTAVPESPASSAGDETSAWIVKDSSAHTGTAGSGDDTLLFSDPVLRTRDAATTAAKGRQYFSRRDSVRGTVELMGTPDVHLGQTVKLSGVPVSGVDGTYQVIALRHRLDARRGFRTSLTLGGMP